jgi:hypothetical protein
MFIDQFGGAASLQSASAKSDWLLTGILHELSRRGLHYHGQIDVSIIRLAPNYGDVAASMRDELVHEFKRSHPQPKYAELLALGSVTARALAEYLIRVRAPVGLKTMLQNVGKVFEALDVSYPGYVQSGFLGMLVKTLNH